MTLEDTTLPFLAQDCRQAFGPTDGDIVYQQTEVRFQALLAQADDRGSPAIRDHLARKLLPPLAFYQVLRARGMDQAAALDQVRQETRQAAQSKKRDMASLTRLPFAYTLYRLGGQEIPGQVLSPGRVGHPMGPLRRKRDPLQPPHLPLPGSHPGPGLPGAVPPVLRERRHRLLRPGP